MVKSKNHFEIIKAQAGDELALAKVHILSWKQAYKNLLPHDYLEQLDSELESRTKMWTAAIANPNRWAWVAKVENEIVGFVLFGPPRDPNKETYIEIGAIYLLEKAKGKGVGFSLLSKGFKHMKGLGYKKAYCWVLEKNPTIKFYEKSGAQFLDTKKQDLIGSQYFTELMYGWNSMELGE